MQAHIFISGLVQGVGFRQFIQEEATKLGLYGWTRNLYDGRVEAVLQGNKKVIDQLIEKCNKGPSSAVVENVIVEWEDKKKIEKDFQILATKEIIS